METRRRAQAQTLRLGAGDTALADARNNENTAVPPRRHVGKAKLARQSHTARTNTRYNQQSPTRSGSPEGIGPAKARQAQTETALPPIKSSHLRISPLTQKQAAEGGRRRWRYHQYSGLDVGRAAHAAMSRTWGCTVAKADVKDGHHHRAGYEPPGTKAPMQTSRKKQKPDKSIMMRRAGAEAATARVAAEA